MEKENIIKNKILIKWKNEALSSRNHKIINKKVSLNLLSKSFE